MESTNEMLVFSDETVLKVCSQLKSHNIGKVKEGVASLWKFYQNTSSNDQRSKLADKLAQLCLVQHAKNIFTTLEIQNHPAEVSERIADLIFDLFIRLTNYSLDLCKSVTETGFYLILVREVKENFLSLARESPSSLGYSIKTQKAIDCLIILHNVLRSDAESVTVMQSSGLRELLLRITKSAEGNLQIVALMTLCLTFDSQCSPNTLKVKFSKYTERRM